jgi:nanoRNase/pAp phosphatase (c-di-AMP/oligoRNAs hydrolase)
MGIIKWLKTYQETGANLFFFLHMRENKKKEKKNKLQRRVFTLLILREKRKGKLSGMLQNTEWETTYLTIECAQELAYLKTLEAVQNGIEKS